MTGEGRAVIGRLFGLAETGRPVIGRMVRIPVATLAEVICKLWEFRASGTGRHLALRGVPDAARAAAGRRHGPPAGGGMIARSRIMLVFSVTTATALHAAGLWVAGDGVSVRVESGAGAVEARIGSSFADMAQGIVRPAADGTVIPNRQADRVVTPEKPGRALRPDAADTPATAEPDERVAAAAPPAPTAATRPAMARRVSPAATPPAATDAASPATASPATAPQAAPHAPNDPPLQDAAIPKTSDEVHPVRADGATGPVAVDRSGPPPDAEAAPRAGPEAVIAATPREAEGLQVSRRPKARPATVEEAARAARTIARQSRAPDRDAQAQASAGSNAERDATRGSATGTQEATASQAGRPSGPQTQTSGNAAASNYPGKVMARLSRVPRPRVESRGTAVLRFTIAPDGGLAGVSVARSSGSGRLDRAALAVVRSAVPFPRPPRGAQRSFSVRIEGR